MAEALLLLLAWVPVAQGQQGQVSGVFVKPENILFIGNSSISSEELRSIFRSAGTVTAQLSPESMDVYNTDRIAHGLNMLLAFYRNRGFVRAEIKGPDTDFVPGEGGSRIRLLFRISEDHLYRLGQVKIGGIKTLDESILTAMLNIQPGQPLNLAKLNAGVQAIQKAYLSRGYLDIDVRASLDITEKKGLADVLLNIKEGIQYHVGQVDLLGNPLISSLLLRDFLPMQTGDIFAEKTFEACLQNLNELGITPVLTDSDITFKIDREKALVNLEIDLEGKSSRK
jgi:outer membrane protein insertion porin family